MNFCQKRSNPIPVKINGKIVDTGKMTDEEFSSIRGGDYIGGSDAGTICGCNPWYLVSQLYDEKLGIGEPRAISEDLKWTFWFGHRVEPLIAEIFKHDMEEMGVSVEIKNDTVMYTNPDYPFMHVNLDRIIKVNGKIGILELKHTKPRNFESVQEWKSGILPKAYECQVRAYMAVMNIDFTYVCCYWDNTPDGHAIILVERDLFLEDMIMANIENFVYDLNNGIRPPENNPDSSLVNQYLIARDGELPHREAPIEFNPDAVIPELNETFSDLAQQMIEVEEQKKLLTKQIFELEKRQQNILNVLLPIFRQNSTDYASVLVGQEEINGALFNNVVGIVCDMPKRKGGYDIARLSSEHPDLALKWATIDTTISNKSREEQRILKEYKLPDEFNPNGKPRYSVSVKQYPQIDSGD